MMFKTSLDDILSAFTDIDAKLTKFIEIADGETDSITHNLRDLENKRLSLINQKARATKVRNNIKGLVGV